MATKKIRVYELARELGVENHVVLELCEELRVGVKSHSSSIDDPSADRVRRLADTRGLRGAPIVEEPPAPKEKKAAKPAARAAEPTPTPAEEPEAAPAPPRIVSTKPAAASSAPAAPPAAPAPAKRVVSSSGAPAPAPAPASQAPEFETPRAAPPRPPRAPAAPAARAPQSEKPTQGRAPIPPPPSGTESGGKPIPPPPGRRVPPPPPGPGGRAAPPAGRGRPGGSGGGPGGPRSGGFSGGPRPSGGPGGGPRPGGFGGGPGGPGGPGGLGGPGGGAPGGGRGGPGGGRGGPGGGRGGPGGGRGGPGQRPRKKKRRRSLEEFGPQEAARLTPTDAPVPEGDIVVSRGITIQEFAPKLNRTSADLVRMLFDAGEMVTSTQSLADEMIELIGEALNANVILVEPGSELEHELQALFNEDEEEEDESLLLLRAPVITVMGHVDHGKTTLLDFIRSANVVSGEAGGITQHIGAYRVIRDDKHLTFIDTPGHEAFTQMRARGARATDIAILVVAADDGVMPQTVEAISHAKNAEVPIVVAVTKADREDADGSRVRQQLVENELVPEEWGGDTIVVDVSGKTGLGIDALLDSLLLVAEVEDLRANPDAPARAFVLESNLDTGRGPVATVLVERGTLRVGDPVVAGGGWGRVRAMFDEHGESVAEAGPSVPVEVLGLDDVPLAGDELRVAPDDKTARLVAEARARRRRAVNMSHPTVLAGGARLEDIFAVVQRGEVATLNLVLKSDVQGSLEAVTDALKKLDAEHDEVRLSFVHRGVGGITESDINLAAVSNATVIGFNVRPDRKAREAADYNKVEMRLYEVIYQVLEDVNSALMGMLAPEFEEVVTGDAEVREVFSVPRAGKVAGCFVRNGTITRGSKVRFLREGVVIWNGSISSLKRFKEDAREVREGFECGIGLENYSDLKPGDVIETYELKEIARSS